MNSAWFEDVSHPAQDFKKEEEEIEYWDNFCTFYHEVVANKHLWKRDLLAITFIDTAVKYGYVGLSVIHPYKNRLITLEAGGHDYYPIAKVDIHRYGYREVTCSSKLDIEWEKDNCNKQLESFLKKYPELKLAHGSTLNYKGKNIKTTEKSVFDYKLKEYTGYFALIYDVELDLQDGKGLDKCFEMFPLTEIHTKDFCYSDSSCHEVDDDAINSFIKMHKSFPKEMVRANFTGLARAKANITKKNEKLKAEYEKKLKELEEKEKRDRFAAVESAKNQRLKSKGKQKVQQKGEDFLYLMKNNRDGRYKIGISKDPKHRESTLQSQEPDVVLVGSWGKLAKYERSWHNYFAEWRKRGEWFDLEEAQVRFMVDKCLNKKGPPKRKKTNEEALENLG